MGKNTLLLIGIIAVLSSLLIKMLLDMTKENSTINLLYSDNNNEKSFRMMLEKVKEVLSKILFIIGIILIVMNFIYLF